MAGVISTPHTLATEAGMQMFRAGGNAVDAALAAAAVLTVVYPHQCALGGDAFALVESASGDVTAYNGSGAAPAGLDADLLRARYDGIPDAGPLSISVPGLVAAWYSLSSSQGTLPWAELLAPAIALADDGVAVSRSLAAG
ncbi:gamma-glutamyltransferase, partial [Spongiibacter sp. UBA6593]